MTRPAFRCAGLTRKETRWWQKCSNGFFPDPVHRKAPTFSRPSRPTDIEGVGSVGFRHIASVMAARLSSSREKLVLLCLAGRNDSRCISAHRPCSAFRRRLGIRREDRAVTRNAVEVRFDQTRLSSSPLRALTFVVYAFSQRPQSTWHLEAKANRLRVQSAIGAERRSGRTPYRNE